MVMVSIVKTLTSAMKEYTNVSTQIALIQTRGRNNDKYGWVFLPVKISLTVKGQFNTSSGDVINLSRWHM